MINARVSLAILTLLACLWAAMGHLVSAADTQHFTLTPDEHGMVVKTPDGRTVYRYMTKKPADTNLAANSVCCLHPVLTPTGVRAVDFASEDHRHHRGIFLAWHTTQCGDQGADFWGWGEMGPTDSRVIQNRDVKLVKADADGAVIDVRNDWLIGDQTVIKEELSIGAKEVEGVFVIDMAFHLKPLVRVTLNRTAFGGFCVKGRKDGRATYTSPVGKIDLPGPHHLKPETNWPAAAWYDYSLALEEGKTVGVAVVNHPKNPPTTWHNLEPIAMLNPCIAAPAAVSLAKDEVLVLRYRIVVHDGSPPVELLNALAEEYQKS